MILLFLIPTLLAVWEDRNGDKHPNLDLLFTGSLMIYISIAAFLLKKDASILITGVFHQIGLFIFVFPYLVNYVHFKRKVTSNPKWWDHLSKSAVPDKWPIWYKRHWITRMVIAFLIGLGLSIPYYIL